MLKKKLRQQKGETLVEAMVSLLVAVLSMGLLSSAIMAAANINKLTQEADTTFDQELRYAEMRISDDEYPMQEDVTLRIEYESLGIQELEVNVYGGEESSLISYQEAEVNEP